MAAEYGLSTLTDRLIQSIVEFVEIDVNETEIQSEVDGQVQLLIANIPLESPRLRR